MTDLSAFDPVRGAAREAIDADELAAVPPGSLAEDPRRVRPHYFDGRFLTARDLTRDQQYALIRQADFGQIAGGGVIEGLAVARGPNPGALVILPGQGLTGHGESVVLRKAVIVALATLPLAERVGGSIGLDFEGDTRVGTRSGIFILALRAVEYVEQPSLAYPTTVGGKASIEHALLTEATAIVCIELDHVPPSDGAFAARAALARQIFSTGGLQKLGGEALPLAVVALERGRLLWVDQHLVRRRAGIDGVLGFGLGERVTREAYQGHYSAFLNDVLRSRAQSGQDRRVVARDHFAALPPAGWLPREAVELVEQQLVQWFFPPEFEVELSLVPSDELPRAMEEALALAPLELAPPATGARGASVLVLIPVPRDQLTERVAELETRVLAPPPSVDPGARARPIEALDALRRRRFRPAHAADVAVNLAPWEALLAQTSLLYYVRRRALPVASFIVPRFEPVSSSGADPAVALGAAALAALTAAGEIERPPTGPTPLRRFDYLVRRIAPAARTPVLNELRALLELPPLVTLAGAAQKLLVNGAVSELSYRARARVEDLRLAGGGAPAPGKAPAAPAPASNVRVRALRVEDVVAVRTRYAAAGIGPGLAALIAAQPGLDAAAVREVLGQSLWVVELDAAARQLAATNVPILASGLLARARAADLDGIGAVLELALAPLAPGQVLDLGSLSTPG